MSEQHPAENDAHRIVATRPYDRGIKRYTCACGEVILAHPDVRDEAFEFHAVRPIPSGRTNPSRAYFAESDPAARVTP